MKTFFALFFLLSFQYLNGQNDHYCNKSHALINENLISELNALDDDRIDIKSYWFDWSVDPNKIFIEGSAKVLFTSLVDDLDRITLSLSTKLKVDSIKSEFGKLLYSHNNNYDLNINFAMPLMKNENTSLTIYYNGFPANNGFGCYNQAKHANTNILWTFSVPFASREWWPCKNGNTDKIDSIQTSITTKKLYKAASNGKLMAVVEKDGEHDTYVWKHQYAIVPYLVAFAVTNYTAYSDEVVFHDGKKMEVLNYVYPESLASAKVGTNKFLTALSFFDSLLVRYPFVNDKYGHAQFGWGGGMEHQTMSFVTNFEYGLLAHELAHQWFGDMVTCKSWTDVWLNEGFATYMEGLAQERFYPAQWLSWRQSKQNNITSTPSGAVYVKDSTNINRIFDGRLTYDKGAYLLHQLRWIVGDENFFMALRNYINENKYNFATTKSLQQHLEATSGLSLTEYFNDYFYGEGYPKYTINWQAKENNKVALSISQTPSSSKVAFFEMPLPIKFSDGISSKILRLDNNKNNQYFEVDLPFKPTKVQLDPDLWLITRGAVVKEAVVTATSDLNDENISISPNPATAYIHIIYKNHDLKNVNIIITNIDGKVVKSTTSADGYVDVSELAGATYFVKVVDINGGVLGLGKVVLE